MRAYQTSETQDIVFRTIYFKIIISSLWTNKCKIILTRLQNMDIKYVDQQEVWQISSKCGITYECGYSSSDERGHENRFNNLSEHISFY